MKNFIARLLSSRVRELEAKIERLNYDKCEMHWVIEKRREMCLDLCAQLYNLKKENRALKKNIPL